MWQGSLGGVAAQAPTKPDLSGQHDILFNDIFQEVRCAAPSAQVIRVECLPISRWSSSQERRPVNNCILVRTTTILTLFFAFQLSYTLRSRIERVDKWDRRSIVSRLREGCSPLFIACKRGNVEIVEYLVSMCNANLEQRGLYEVQDDR